MKTDNNLTKRENLRVKKQAEPLEPEGWIVVDSSGEEVAGLFEEKWEAWKWIARNQKPSTTSAEKLRKSPDMLLEDLSSLIITWKSLQTDSDITEGVKQGFRLAELALTKVIEDNFGNEPPQSFSVGER